MYLSSPILLVLVVLFSHLLPLCLGISVIIKVFLDAQSRESREGQWGTGEFLAKDVFEMSFWLIHLYIFSDRLFFKEVTAIQESIIK